MFFKKREWTPPAWWVEIGAQRRVYARRLADLMGRSVSRVPAPRMKVYAFLFVLLLAVVNGWMMVEALRVHDRRLLMPFRRQELPGVVPPSHPVKAPDLGVYLDSLAHDPAVVRSMDSLLKAMTAGTDTLGKPVDGDSPDH